MENEAKKVAVLGAQGRLDTHTAPAFEAEVTRSIDAGNHYLVLDFSGLTYISSAGLKLTLRAVQRLRVTGGALAIAAPREQVAQILRIAGYNNFIPITTTVAEAEAACMNQPGISRSARFSPELGLNLPESFYVLAFNERDGRIESPREIEIGRRPAACAVMELALRERIEWDLKQLRVTDKSATGELALDRTLTILADHGPRPIEEALRHVFRQSSEIDKEIVQGLIKKGVMASRDKKIAGIIPSHRLALCSKEALTALREDLRGVLMGNQIPDMKEAVLVGLVNTCGLFAGILTPEEVEACRPRISQLWRLDLIGQTLSRMLHEVRRLAMLTHPF